MVAYDYSKPAPEYIPGLNASGYSVTSATPVKIAHVLSTGANYRVVHICNVGTGAYTTGIAPGPTIYFGPVSGNLTASGTPIYCGAGYTTFLLPTEKLYAIAHGNGATADVRVWEFALAAKEVKFVLNFNLGPQNPLSVGGSS